MYVTLYRIFFPRGDYFYLDNISVKDQLKKKSIV